MEDYLESELSKIFLENLVTKNIVLGTPTLFLQCDVFF